MIPDQPPRPLSPTLRQSPVLGPSILPNTPHPRASVRVCPGWVEGAYPGGPASGGGRRCWEGQDAGSFWPQILDPKAESRQPPTAKAGDAFFFFFFFGDAFCSVFTESEPLYSLPLSVVNLIPDEQTWEVSHSPVRGTRLTRLLANAQKWLMKEGR